MSGPPDKSLGLSASDFADVKAFATAIGNAAEQRFPVPDNIQLPDPHNPGNTWIVLSGYQSQPQDKP